MDAEKRRWNKISKKVSPWQGMPGGWSSRTVFWKAFLRSWSILLVLVIGGTSVRSDEGMWLFSDLPTAYLKSQYGFEPTSDLARHVMLSSVRFNSGGSASFVSSRGLVLTNHHVAADMLQKISTPEHNYMRDGFLAKTPSDEIKAPDLELNQLVSIEDVTKRVEAAVETTISAGEAFRARRAVMSEIEKESLDQTGLRSDVVTLHGGAKYHLYRYKKYTDVRLAWAPEVQAAFFGGDADNFEYPRYNLDVALFRVYEEDQPARVKHFLKYSEAGAAEGELVFVAGNPGKTQRIFTTAALEYLRDHRFPFVLNLLRRREILLQQFSFEGEEQKRRAHEELFGIQNSRKALTGMLAGLQNPAFLHTKKIEEREFLARLEADDSLREAISAWRTIADTQARLAKHLDEIGSFSRLSRYYDIAETLVLMAAEDEKPSAERLREYRDSARASLEHDLFSPAPIHEDLEQVKLADALAYFAELRGADDLLVVEVFGGKSPHDRAADLIQGTRLQEVAVRRSLAEGGLAAIVASDDLMIQLAKSMEQEFRRLREIHDEAAEIQRQAYARITAAKVALEGASTYPDATFTLRLAFGVVKGYQEAGQTIPPWTTLGGAYKHETAHQAKGDWKLPTTWHAHQEEIDLTTPLNFVCTADIIGGNSGSPVINRQGEFVGVIFDGNIQSLTADYLYSDEVSRAVSVHSSGIREALRTIYGAGHIVEELGK